MAKDKISSQEIVELMAEQFVAVVASVYKDIDYYMDNSYSNLDYNNSYKYLLYLFF